MRDAIDRKVVARLLRDAGFSGEDFTVQPFPPGANNRVFIVHCDGKKTFLKIYFRHPSDPRDRHAAEVAFVRFAWARGVRAMPRLLASNGPAAALFEFVPGPKLRPEEIKKSALDQALAFFEDINAHKDDTKAARLPLASEACFSVMGHLECVDGRVTRLAETELEDTVGQAARSFVLEHLLDAWRRVHADALGRCRDFGIDPGEALPSEARCLSPSDFGFHNAIMARDGKLRFIDFEYAGWDDPAGMVADFFCQKAVPVPLNHFRGFARHITGVLPHPGHHLARMAILLPVYQIKWCCILLNEFLPTGMARRRFAGNREVEAETKAAQIVKAEAALAQLPDYVDLGDLVSASAA